MQEQDLNVKAHDPEKERDPRDHPIEGGSTNVDPTKDDPPIRPPYDGPPGGGNRSGNQ
jgi:hypothetical protein